MNSEEIFDCLENNIPLSIDQLKYTELMEDTLSMYNLAFMYDAGTHPDGKNIEKAVELYEKAVELGYDSAMNNLACIRIKTFFIQKDKPIKKQLN